MDTTTLFYQFMKNAFPHVPKNSPYWKETKERFSIGIFYVLDKIDHGNRKILLKLIADHYLPNHDTRISQKV